MGAMADPADAGRYFGEDLYDYPVCFQCVRWSPFMVYLEDNKQAKKFWPFEKGMQLYCPKCSPKQDDFQRKFPGEKLYRDESILNDRQLMELLGQFRYDHPTAHGFAQLDRIIITENAKLQPYKKLAKQSLPLSRKVALLMNLFPAMHRMANRKFPSYRKMRSAVRATAAGIAEGYMNLSETEHSQLQDNFDVLVDRTPMHVKISSQQQQQQRSLMPPPVAPVQPVLHTEEEPAAYVTVSSLGDISVESSESHVDGLRMDPDSEDDANQSSGESSLAISSQEPSSHASAIIALSSQEASNRGPRRINLDDQLQRAATQLSSQSLQLSSQDISDHNNPLGSQSPRIPPRNRRVSSSDSQASSTASVATTSRKRSLDSSDSDSSLSSVAAAAVVPPPAPSPNDGQQPGPSSKRARNAIPTNPSPAQFVRNPVGRMPRLLGA